MEDTFPIVSQQYALSHTFGPTGSTCRNCLRVGAFSLFVVVMSTICESRITEASKGYEEGANVEPPEYI